MAAHIRAFDWAATPLGPIAAWSERLKLIVEQMLANPLVSSLVCGPERVLIYNDAAAKLYGDRHPAALGRPLPETFPEGWATVAPFYARAFAGETVQVAGQPLDTRGEGEAADVFDALLTPVHETDGRVAFVHMMGSEIGARARVEATLRESEARQSLLIASWAQALWETDAEGVVVADSPSWRAYTGQTLEEWLGYGWLDAIHPDDRAYAERQWRAAIAARGLVNAEFRLRAPDGGWRWTNVRAAAVRNAQGAIEKWAGMNIDIDARKRSEAALRESEELRRIAVTGGRMGTWRWNLHDERILGDALFMGLWGFPPSDEPRPLRDFTARMSDQGQAEMAEMVSRAVAAGEEFDGQLAVVDGPTKGRWIRWRGRAERERPWIVNGVTFDVTEQRLADERLRTSEARQRALIEGMPQLVWCAVDDGHWTWASPQWTAYTGLTERESRGRGWLKAVHPDDREAARATWSRAVETGTFEVDYRLCHTSDQHYRWFQTRATPVRDAAGAIAEWLGTSTDIDDLRAMQVRLEVLVNELQHRARNLLGVVTAVAGKTLRQGSTVESFEDRLQALSRAQGLLSQAGSDTVEVGALVRAELSAYAQDGSEKVHVGGPDVQLTARQVQNFALALHELTTNAVKYGALKDGTGSLSVTWEVLVDRRDRRRLALSWVESGVALQAGKVTHRGYGTELIQEALGYALEADVAYAMSADGVRCRIEMPIHQPG
ncbi:MAG: PAS domain-containing protein [Parafilimonas terrae]|nr:PAS domain-containing protein [Parafilimonas terrae]